MARKGDTLPDPFELKRTFVQHLEAHRKLLIGAAVLLSVLVVAVIFYSSLSRQNVRDQWHELLAEAQSPFPNPAALMDLAEKGDGPVKAFSLFVHASDLAQDSPPRYDEALEDLDRLEDVGSDNILLSLPSPDRRYSLVEQVRRNLEANRDWAAEHGYEDVEPDTSTVALVETSKGAFWIGFYPEMAPKHVENFISRAKAGEFNGTKVFSIKTASFTFGGEATMDDDPFNDREPESVSLLEPEPGRYRIEQDRGSVSSFATDEGESPLRVTVAVGLGGDQSLDKRQTIFGMVLKNRYPELATLDAIRNEKTYESSDDPLHHAEKFLKISDSPVEPIEVLRVSIWKDGALAEGHRWDTSAVVEPKKPAASANAGDSTRKEDDSGDGKDEK